MEAKRLITQFFLSCLGAIITVLLSPVHLFALPQHVDTLKIENSDCAHPVLIHDTIVITRPSPQGTGNDLEISGNGSSDPLYLEHEHNTVWYQFTALKTGRLSFEIIPEDVKDDYDFMLFQFEGKALTKRIIEKKLKPVRSCISRCDPKIQSTTGLQINDSLPFFVHSGKGPSFVQHLYVEKGQKFLLLVDNFRGVGKGHTIKFHYRKQDSRQLFVGKLVPFDEILFETEDFKFRPGSDKGLDSLYKFLIQNPGLQIEVQGHVNSAGPNIKPTRYDAQTLSELRANAICQHLVARGIDSSRLKGVGYGDFKKRIQNPRNEKEYKMNMRAEVKIVSLVPLPKP